MLILILQLVKRLSPCHQPHVTDFRELVREEAQETKDPDLGCLRKDGGDQGSALLSSAQFWSALLLSHLVASAQHFPQPPWFFLGGGGRPIKSLCLQSVFLWKATTREVQWNLWSLIGSHFLFLHHVSWVTNSLCRPIGG